MLYIAKRRYYKHAIIQNQLVKKNWEQNGWVSIEDGIEISKEDFEEYFEIYLDNGDH